jgi:tRNA(adenine34) deaminase
MEDLEAFDRAMMREALREAKRAYAEGEVPVGAVLVADGMIVARGRNHVELIHDATAHAEMVCLTSASGDIQNWRLNGCTLYCTLEPCAMCFGAMTLCRIDRLVYGAPDKRHGACGSWVDLAAAAHPIHRFEITKGVEAEACAKLMVDFFRERRALKEQGTLPPEEGEYLESQFPDQMEEAPE